MTTIDTITHGTKRNTQAKDRIEYKYHLQGGPCHHCSTCPMFTDDGNDRDMCICNHPGAAHW